MKKKYVIIIFFVSYLILLIKVIVFKYPTVMWFSSMHEVSVRQQFANGNFVPLKTILNYISGEPTWNIAIRNIVGNIILFIPLGLFVPIIYRRLITLKHVLVIAFLLSVALESAQGLLRAGAVDVDDVILNVLGAVVGYGIFVGVRHYVRLI